MSDEMKETLQNILKVDAVAVAVGTGHLAALTVVQSLRGGDPEDNQLFYRMFEPLEEGQSAQDDYEKMADYVCNRLENVGGEQLFRKAAELAIHDAPASSYETQPFEIQLAYRLFAKTCRLTFIDLSIEQREAKAKLEREARKQKRKSIPIEDQTYAKDDDPMAIDPVFGAAAKSLQKVPEVKGDLTDNGKDPDPADGEKVDGEAVMSIGEAPVKHLGKPKRGGARTKKPSNPQ